MVVKLHSPPWWYQGCLRVVLSHMVVKRSHFQLLVVTSLRVVLSHMVVKLDTARLRPSRSLRVVLSHMVVKLGG